MKKHLLSFVCSLCCLLCMAQSPVDATIPVQINLSSNPVGVQISWPNPSGNASILLSRRLKDAGVWTILLNANGSNVTQFTDVNVLNGGIYEYALRMTTNITSYGYVHVGVNLNAVHDRGKVMLIVDSQVANNIPEEYAQYKEDLTGDGWTIIENIIDVSAATVQTVKFLILSQYTALNPDFNTVVLIGKIPVPYAGNTAWDGHQEHAGAWPADTYYGELTSNWTDATVNVANMGRAANNNVPNDGKFDQSFLPSPVELSVGRIDFSRMDASFGSNIELYRRYFKKNHAWRHKQYVVENKALVDDNFGYFNGEAFASNGFRNAYPIVGTNVVTGDFFNDTDNQSFLFGYGTGPGNYNGAGGVGSSSNFASDSINIVFSNLFGSYHGDWDYEINPFMVAALASKGGILTCSWAGRPHHFYQGLSAGETIGYCTKITQNAGSFQQYVNSFGKGGVHASLLGDPTLRALVVEPPSSLKAEPICAGIKLHWQIPLDAEITGYHVYKQGTNGKYTQINTELITVDSFIDINATAGENFYQLRSIKTTSTFGGGTWINNSVGIFTNANYTPIDLAVSNDFVVIDCNDTIKIFVLSPDPELTYSWTTPDGILSGDHIFVAKPGAYSVTATNDIGCSVSASIFVSQLSNPQLGIPNLLITCNMPCITVGPFSNITDSIFTFCSSGIFEVTVTHLQNGCPVKLIFFVESAPELGLSSADITNASAPNANDGTIDLVVGGGSGNYSVLWNTGATSFFYFGLAPGTYTATITDIQYGCSQIYTFTVGVTVATVEPKAEQWVHVSPNPANDYIMVLTEDGHDVRELMIIDQTGKVVYKNLRESKTPNPIKIDVKNWASGIYYFHGRSDTGVFSDKILVLH